MTRAREVIVKRKSRFGKAQVIVIVREADTGVNVRDLCREYRATEAAPQEGRSKYGESEASAAGPDRRTSRMPLPLGRRRENSCPKEYHNGVIERPPYNNK